MLLPLLTTPATSLLVLILVLLTLNRHHPRRKKEVGRRSRHCSRRGDGRRPPVRRYDGVDVEALKGQVLHLLIQIVPLRDDCQDEPRVVLVPSCKSRKSVEKISRHTLHDSRARHREPRLGREFEEVPVEGRVLRHLSLWLLRRGLPAQGQDLLCKLRENVLEFRRLTLMTGRATSSPTVSTRRGVPRFLGIVIGGVEGRSVGV